MTTTTAGTPVSTTVIPTIPGTARHPLGTRHLDRITANVTSAHDVAPTPARVHSCCALHFFSTQLCNLACHSFRPWSPGAVSTGPVLKYKTSMCSPAHADPVTALRAVCWAASVSHPLTPHPSAQFHVAKTSCCGTRRTSLVMCSSGMHPAQLWCHTTC